jgi:uncharacterized protein YecT (DUF1311 family)
MTIDRPDLTWREPFGREPLGSGTYRGFSAGVASAAPTPLRPAGRPIPRTATIGLGVAGALALGLLFGLWAKPNLGGTQTAAPMQPVTAAQAAKMNVEVAPPVPPSPVPRAAGKLEVLPPGAAQAAARQVAMAVPVAPVAPRPVSLDARLSAPAPAPRIAGLQTAGLDSACANAGGRAAQMVCADPDLADADRELNRAYRRALHSGVPTDQLRDEQRDWLAIREEAARRSPRAVARIYEQRIDELNQIADEGPG